MPDSYRLVSETGDSSCKWQTGRNAAHETPLHACNRDLFVVAATFLWFSALKYLQLPDATVIANAIPLTTLILTYLIFKEVIRIYLWSAVAAGFLGIFIILLPKLGGAPTGTN